MRRDSDLKLIAELTETFRDVMFSEASFVNSTSGFESSSTLQLVADLNSTEISAESSPNVFSRVL